MIPTPPWYARMPLFGNLGWPIALKEIRSLIRRNRYFWSQFIYLAVLAVGVIIVIAVMQGSNVDRERISAGLFWTFFGIQVGLVTLVFPAFAATSFSGERSEKSFELVVTTDLRPTELVWGKFIGIFGNCCYFLLVTLPLLGTCFLFGGVSVGAAVQNYLLLLLQAAVLTIYGIWVSSTTSSNVRAIMASYVVDFVVGGFALGLIVAMAERGRGADGIISIMMAESPRSAMIALALGSYVLVAVFVFCFIAAVHRLSSPESNQATALRVYTLVVLVVGFGMLYWGVPYGRASMMTAPSGRSLYGLFGVVSAIVWVVVGIAALHASGGRVETPRRTARAALDRPWRTRLFWILLPGGGRGFLFGVFLVALTGLSLWVFATWTLDLDTVKLPVRLGGGETSEREVLGELLAVHGLGAIGLVAYLSYSFLLACCRIRSYLNLAIVLSTATLLTLLSVVMLIQGPGSGLSEPKSPLFASSLLVTWVQFYNEGSTQRENLIQVSYWLHGAVALACFLIGLFILRRRGVRAWGVAMCLPRRGRPQASPVGREGGRREELPSGAGTGAAPGEAVARGDASAVGGTG